MLSVSELYIYPIKSLGGIALDTAMVTNRGLQHDRRYMLVDENNIFFTQREYPAMAFLRTAIEDDDLLVYHKDAMSEKLELHVAPEPTGTTTTVKIWDDWCEGEYISERADDWFSDKLGISCRLVYMPDSTKRKVDPLRALNDDITSFTDGYPIMMLGQSSLDDLNGRLIEQLPMNRFRPNIVYTGGQPFEEDVMEHFSINNINFFGVKPCARCPIPTTNQETGVRGKEPLKTLSQYRVANNKVLFGQHVLCAGTGIISVGDSINVLKRKTALAG
ncbi:MAG: MOSC N-terminal beta barrel domain-containing protein [Ginsengibacter sp.]